MQKKALLINDLSGIGKVAMSPMNSILNCGGLDVSLLPTCILSSHTGGLKGVHINDYSDGMDGFLSQWKELGIKFDAFITGYFRSEKQIDKILDFKTSTQTKETILIVDPVMADGGKLYSGFTLEYVQKINTLCNEAELILPNFTEACLLSGRPYIEEAANIEEIKELTLALSEGLKKSVIITGTKLKDELIIAYFDKKTNKFGYQTSQKLPYNFFGTGDMFTAIISTCFIYNIDLEKSVKLANDWLLKCLKHTIDIKKDIRYGICFEPFLKDLIEAIEILKSKSAR